MKWAYYIPTEEAYTNKSTFTVNKNLLVSTLN